MRNRLLILLMLVSSITFGQVTLDSARNYVNSNIVTNGTKAITGAKLNTSLNNIITAVGLQRKVDSIYYNGGADSLVYNINTKRYALPVASGIGGGSLSDLLYATGSNVIDNANNTQEWQWNSLTSGNGLVLSSSSTGAASNTQTVFSVNQSGANSTSAQTTYGAKIANTKTGTSSTNYGLAITATGAATNLPLLANGVAEIARFDGTTNPYLTFYKNGVLKSYLGQYNSADDHLYIRTASTNSIYMGTNNATQVVIENNKLGVNVNPSYPLDVTGTAVSGRIAKFTGGGVEIITTNDAAFFHQRASVFGTFGVNSSGNFIIGCNAFGTGTQIAIHSTRNNVGIGTITPNESAKLDVSSTTQGFAPPEMTATQASAIVTTSRKLIIYVTDTNGTFTSAGLWMWNGTVWKLILAE